MYILKKALAPFLLPPGIFAFLLIALGTGSLFKNNRKVGIANLVIGFFIWLLSIAPVSNALYRNLESGFAIPKDPKGDVIILLSGGIYDEAPDFSGVGSPRGETLSRLVTAARLQKQLGLPIIVSAGRPDEDKTPAAEIIKRFLMDLGIPVEKIIMEIRSRDTIENVRFTAGICKRRGYQDPILVTCAYHLKRSVRTFKKAGLEVSPFPAGFRSWQNREYVWTDYLPHRSSLEEVSTAIREQIGLLFYELIC